MSRKKDVYSTWCSQAVTHLSTNHARRCLTSVIGREPVISTWYGRRQKLLALEHYIATRSSFVGYHNSSFKKGVRILLPPFYICKCTCIRIILS